MPKAIETRVSRATAGGWVLEKIYVPKSKFKKGAMISTMTGKRSTFVSRKPRPDVWLIIGCLPKNYDKKKKVCKRTTAQKMIKAISESTAKKLLGRKKVTKRRKVRRVKRAKGKIVRRQNTGEMSKMKTEVFNLATSEVRSYSLPPREAVIAAYAQSRGDWNTWDYEKRYGKLIKKGKWTVTISDWTAMTRKPSRKEIRKLQKGTPAKRKATNTRNPCPKLYASKKVKGRNPQLMIVTNPASLNKYPSRSIGLAGKAYKRFHFTRPAGLNEVNIPTGWPKVYMAIGECERFDVKTPKGVVSRRFTGKRPVLTTTSSMKNLYIFGKSMGIPAGKAVRVDYRVPPHSGRNKWSRRWWHPHKSHPSVRPHRGGGAVKVSGSGLKITPRGIEG